MAATRISVTPGGTVYVCSDPALEQLDQVVPGEAPLERLDVTDPVPTSAAAGVTITPLVPQATTTPTRLTFRGTQPEDTVSAPQNVTVRNTGTADLHIGDVTTTGADPGDFLITGCRSAVPPGGSCQFQVRFVPEGKGARTATMDIFSDDPEGPATVSLAGMGGSLPAGPQGPPGPRGKPGRSS